MIKAHGRTNLPVCVATGIAAVVLACLTFTGSSSHPLSVTFLRWSDTPVFPANAPEELRSMFPKGEYALLGVTNNGTRSLRFNTRAVEYESDGRWIKVIPNPKQWLGLDGYRWESGDIVWLTRPPEVPRGFRWRIRYVCALDVSRDANAALRKRLNQIAGKALGTNTLAFCAPVEMVSPEIPPANVHDGAANGRPASINEIKGLFDLATLHPQRTRFLAELTISEPPHTKEQIADALEFQNKLMEERDRVFRKHATEIQTVRSNTIVEQASGRRVFHVQEWYSGNKYRLDQTEEATINAAFLKAFPEGYRNTYVNIRDPQFSPYESFSVNHQLRDAQLTKDPKMHYAPYRLWQCLGMSERVRVPLVMALVDKQSMKPVAPGVERNESLLKLDSWKMESIHNGSDPNWHLEAFDEQLGGTPVTCFKLRGRCLDVWSPPLEISTITTSGFPQIEVSYWIAQKSGRNVCLQAVLTNSTQHAGFVSKVDEVDEHGYPRIWETKALENGSLTKGLRVVFKEIDDSPQFSDEEVFSPVFPTNYIVEDLTSGEAVILRNPNPGER